MKSQRDGEDWSHIFVFSLIFDSFFQYPHWCFFVKKSISAGVFSGLDNEKALSKGFIGWQVLITPKISHESHNVGHERASSTAFGTFQLHCVV